MFRRRREQEPTPTWLKWAMVLFVLYAAASYQKPDTPDNPNKLRQATQGASKDLNLYKHLNFDQYKEKIFPTYVAAMRINDIEQGKGLPAVCGQQATIAYETIGPDGKPFPDSASKEKPLRFVIGERKAMPVFEQGVIGMQPGGSRSLLAPPNMSYGVEGFKRDDVSPQALMQFKVTLLDVSPALPDPEASPYRIAVTQRGISDTALCGDTIKVHVTVWDVSGKKLFSTKEGDAAPLTLTLGKSEVFSGLEQGVVGMQKGEGRTLVVPPAFQKPLRKEIPDVKIPLPANQTVLVDVESIP